MNDFFHLALTSRAADFSYFSSMTQLVSIDYSEFLQSFKLTQLRLKTYKQTPSRA